MTARDPEKAGPEAHTNGGGAFTPPHAQDAIPGAPECDGGASGGGSEGVSDAALRSLAGYGRFARVPFGAIRDKRLTFAYLRVLVAFGERADSNGNCYPSVRKIAEDSLCSRRTVQRAIRKLVKAGYLSTIPGGMMNGRRVATRYTLIYRPDGRPTKRASS